ncbi:NAD(P)-binding protein [Thelephora ganbajun]|uniref:NAD(P)-binding protein n=1 Tax=Thelephora ganbajun TaxID=370292 RepID=A0ACB6ZV98_THEGA|nr:NAD(P)-binding protein [Thelephora ganbajun]
MSATTKKAIAVIAGIGNGTGTRMNLSRVQSLCGYRVALIARNPGHLRTLANEINVADGEAESFPIKNYGAADIQSAFSSISSRFPSSEIRVAIYNAGEGTFKKFFDVTDEDIERSTTTGIVGPFAFSRAVITAFKNNELSDPLKHPNEGARKRGTLIFTGATAALRGNTFTSLFSVTKFALRSLSQSLSKEFGPENIHVAHSIIDGGVLTDRTRTMRNDPQWETSGDVRLHPDSIAKAYKYLVEQDSSAFTWELDVRPAHEKW